MREYRSTGVQRECRREYEYRSTAGSTSRTGVQVESSCAQGPTDLVGGLCHSQRRGRRRLLGLTLQPLGLALLVLEFSLGSEVRFRHVMHGRDCERQLSLSAEGPETRWSGVSEVGNV